MKNSRKLTITLSIIAVIAITLIIKISTIYNGKGPIQFSFGEKAGIFFWSNVLMPLVSVIGGESYPDGRVKEMSYGEHADEKLDIITSSQSISKKVAVVHIHGGAWLAGTKGSFYSKPLLKFSDAGYLVFSINYPLAPNAQHPNLLRSLLKALAWIKTNYPQYEIHLIGDSAGGNLAMMLGIYISNPELLKMLDSTTDVNTLPKIKTVVDLFGVNDRTSWIEDGFPSAKLFSKVYFDNTTTPEIPLVPMDFDTIPVLPPTFIVGAGKDELLRSSKIWAEQVTKQSKEVQFKIYEGAAHGFFSFGDGCEELSSDMLLFFEKY
ncbi:MAG: alpha/beta hydrolase [Cytophagales bacterium]|nr:MAG: alpha/beta hydrolase [Cytophagales bacterium]